MPAQGNIAGAELLLLQGLVCLLRDSDALLSQSQTLMDGYGPASVLDGLLEGSLLPDARVDVSVEVPDSNHTADNVSLVESVPDTAPFPITDEPVLPEIPEPAPCISSYGLW